MTAENTTPLPTEEFLRALFKFDPKKIPNTEQNALPSLNLSFNYGDVFQVISKEDSELWQVKKVFPLSEVDYEMGYVPSDNCRERLESKRISALKMERMNKFRQLLDRFASIFKKNSPIEPVLSYQSLKQVTLTYARPVIILGPLNSLIIDKLLSSNENTENGKFQSCVLHTSRPIKELEKDGRDYYFVTRPEMEKGIRDNLFIDSTEYTANLYGTSLAAVEEMAQTGIHCVLDVDGNAIRQLEDAQVFPVAIYIIPKSASQLKQWNCRLTDEEASKSYEIALSRERELAKKLTAIVQGDTAQEVYEKIRNIIKDHSRSTIWVPA